MALQFAKIFYCHLLLSDQVCYSTIFLLCRSNFTQKFLCFLKAIQFSFVLHLLNLFFNLVRFIFAFLSSLVIKGPSFARMYFFLHGACLSITLFVILLKSVKVVLFSKLDVSSSRSSALKFELLKLL